MILIDNRQNKVEVSEKDLSMIKEMIDYAIRAEGVKCDYELSIIFVDNESIKKLNSEFRGIDRETDVLSFPMLDYEKHKVFKEVYNDFKFTDEYFDDGKLVIGDMALSLEKALSQSKEYDHSFLRETCYLTVHSVLHLLGYDHIEECDKKVMRKREEEILEKFNLAAKVK